MDGPLASEPSRDLNTFWVRETLVTVAMVYLGREEEHSLVGPVGRTYKFPLVERSAIVTTGVQKGTGKSGGWILFLRPLERIIGRKRRGRPLARVVRIPIGR